MGSNYFVVYDFSKQKEDGMLEYQSLEEFSDLEKALEFARDNLGGRPMLGKSGASIDDISQVRFPSAPYVLAAKKSKYYEDYSDDGSTIHWCDVGRFSASELEAATDRFADEHTHRMYAGIELKLFPELGEMNGGGRDEK